MHHGFRLALLGLLCFALPGTGRADHHREDGT